MPAVAAKPAQKEPFAKLPEPMPAQPGREAVGSHPTLGGAGAALAGLHAGPGSSLTGAQVRHGAEQAESAARSKGGAEAQQAAKAGAVAGAAKESNNQTAQRVAPAVEAAARGESVSEQVRHVDGPVKMSAADAVALRSQKYAEQSANAGVGDPSMRDRIRAANEPGAGYVSPFVGIGISGIRNVESDAQQIDSQINGDTQGHGYAAYAPSPTIAAPGWLPNMGGFRDNVQSTLNNVSSGLDAINDVAAVTQYAAAADLAVRIERNPQGGSSVAIDWAALGRMQVSADLNIPGAEQHIQYQTPAQVAQGGYDSVMAEIQARNGNPQDRSQFISLTGHSGGGQSSFYTALRLASDGYTNISLVGVDMAMTPHQRQVLEAMGVQVTNITSNNQGAPDPDGQPTSTNSEIGEVIRLGMGGGQNYYDFNVQRQSDTDLAGRHNITGDANVETTVRFAQYLDSIGQHGNTSPELYQQFLNDTNQQGNRSGDRTASADLLSRVQDNRQKPSTPETGSAMTFPQMLLSVMTPQGATGVANSFGGQIRNEFDLAGDNAANWIRQQGIWGTGWIADGANAFIDNIGNGIGNKIDEVGQWAGENSAEAIRWMQATGIDTSHVAGLEGMNGTNPSVTRSWAGLLSQPGTPEAAQIQRVPIVTPPPSNGNTSAPSQMYAE